MYFKLRFYIGTKPYYSPRNQHGIIKEHSYVTQLLTILDEWTEAIDQGDEIDCIYLDFSKAFDSFPHQRLLIKLRNWIREGNNC